MAKRPPTKTPKKPMSATARKARARALALAEARPPVETHSPRDLLAVVADQAKAIVDQTALIAVLRRPAADTVVRRIVLRLLDLLATAAIDHEAQLRELVTEARAVLDTDGTRSDTVSADVAVRAIAERDQLTAERDAALRAARAARTGLVIELDALKTEHRAHVATLTAERDGARDTLARVADRAGLQNWQTATPEGLRAILGAVEDLRRGHNECFDELQRVEKDQKLYENALCRIAGILGVQSMDGDMDAGRAQLIVNFVAAYQAERDALTKADSIDHQITAYSHRETRQRLADLLAALDMPYDAATYTDTTHAAAIETARELREKLRNAIENVRTADTERDEALTAKRQADELLTLATAENAKLRFELATARALLRHDGAASEVS